MAAAKGNRYAAKYSDKEMQAICHKLIEWAANSKELHFASFAFKELKKSKSWLLMTAEHYPQLKEAIEEAKELLAAKMVNLSFYNKQVNAYTGLAYLPVYDKDYKAMLEWKAKLVAANKQEGGYLNLADLKEALSKDKK